jgi:hypothetical protein
MLRSTNKQVQNIREEHVVYYRPKIDIASNIISDDDVSDKYVSTNDNSLRLYGPFYLIGFIFVIQCGCFTQELMDIGSGLMKSHLV